MSVLAYPPSNDDEILRYCTKKCGYIASTEDQQFFALGCLFCPNTKFLYFDAYIGHVQREHSSLGRNDNGYNGANNSMYNQMCYGGIENGYGNNVNENDDLGDTDAALLVPQMVMVKQEIPDEEAVQSTPAGYLNSGVMSSDVCSQNNAYIKEEQGDTTTPMDADIPPVASYGNNEDYSGDGCVDEDEDQIVSDDDYDDDNYDDLVEESLLNNSGGDLAQHIKDKKMISFVIDSYRRNPYLWDHRNPNFRDRKRRQQFLDWMLAEFKRRFNVSLARDAITRKWDNLRTVYKRECNRMSLEQTNVSSLWYFKELQFLHRLYGANKTEEQPVVKPETIYRKRYTALWNDVSTCRLLALVRSFPCFYDRNHIDYRSKEKRGDALQIIATELQKITDVSTIQISKRISQLRFDYSKQKLERLQCELNNKIFVSNYSYYDQMTFMDADIAPFKCEFCGHLMQTLRDQETHIVVHQTSNLNGYICPECEAVFPDIEQFQRHKQSQHPPPPLSPSLPSLKEPKFFCDLCTARFREKANYDEHMRRHNDELLLPGLANVNFETTTPAEVLNEATQPQTIVPTLLSTTSAQIQSQLHPISISPGIAANPERRFVCEICGKSFTSAAYLAVHTRTHNSNGPGGERTFRCDYQNCGRSYTVRQMYLEHMRLHYTTEGATCDVCGKTFKSLKNLQNHKQIHDAIKRYVCKICGSAFAQAAGLYLHKRRHTRNPDGTVDRHRGRQSY